MKKVKKPKRTVESTETAKDAPHQPMVLWIARNRIREDENWSLDTIFPEVMEEDRTSKLKDLATAQAVGAITHRRMAEQMAKELGFDDYDYDTEIEEIEREQKELPSSLLGIADNIGTSVLGPIVPAKKGVPMGDQFGPGAEREELYPRRYDMSGAATARFRKLQKSAHGTA